MVPRNDSAERRDATGPLPDAAATPPLDPEMGPLWEEVQSALAGERGARAWLRALPSWCRALIAFVALAVTMGSVHALAPGVSLPRLAAAPRLWGALSVHAVLLLALLAAVLHPLQRPEAPSRRARALSVLALSAPFALALWPEGPTPDAGEARYGCGLVGLALGATSIALLRALDRGAANDPRAVLLASAAAGLIANAALMLHCADVSPLHLSYAHAPVGVLLWLGYRRVAPRHP